MEDDEKPIIYFLDDTLEGRRDLEMQLRSLFVENFRVVEIPLKRAVEDYVVFLADHDVAGIFIDQNLDETGEVTGYTGVKLSGYLRTIFPKLPIYLVTGHLIQGELESEAAGDADSVIAKSDLITDSPKSLKFRRQFLRRVEQYDEALTATQQRFRVLLGKKFGSGMSSEEAEEYESLRLSRELATDAAEDKATAAVSEQLNKIDVLLQRVREIKQRVSE